MAISKEQPLRPYVQALGDAVDNGDIVSTDAVQAFDTVADMQAATYLTAGMVCHTNGFHTAGDGGAAFYTISASGTANGMDVLALQGGLYAHHIKETTYPVSITVADINGSAVLASWNDAFVLFDVATSQASDDLSDFLTAQGVDRLSAVIITHMHYDHAGGFAGAADFCDADTDVFVQMPCTSSNSQYQAYLSMLESISSICTTRGIKTPRTPAEGESVTYSLGTLTFHNTDTDNCTVYDSAIANDGLDSGTIGGMNNYSLITRLEVGNFAYVDTGDIEGEAQRLNAQYMQKCDVARNPHHFANCMGYLDFYNALSPDVWLVTLTGYTSESRPAANFSTHYSYLYRYTMYGYSDTVLYPNGSDVSVKYNDGIIALDGDRMLLNAMTSDAMQESIYVALPPSYYNADPYILYRMSIAEFMAATRNSMQHNDLIIYANSGFATNSLLYTQLHTILNTSSSILVSIGAQIFHAKVVNTLAHITDAYFYTSYTDADYGTGHNYKVEAAIASNVHISYDTAITEGDNVRGAADSDTFNKLMRANILSVMLSSGALIPLVRCEGNATGDSGYFSGCATNASGTTLRTININTSGVMSLAKGVNIADGTTSALSITYIEVIC